MKYESITPSVLVLLARGGWVIQHDTTDLKTVMETDNRIRKNLHTNRFDPLPSLLVQVIPLTDSGPPTPPALLPEGLNGLPQEILDLLMVSAGLHSSVVNIGSTAGGEKFLRVL